MLNAIKDFLLFMLMLFASVFELATSNQDRRVYTTDERIAAIEANIDEYNALARYAFEYTDDYAALDSVFIYNIEKQSGESFPEISRLINERILVHHTTDNDYVVFEYNSGTPGYSSSGVYYSEEEVYIVPQSNSAAEYDEETGRYMAYFNANCVEVIKVSDHWYFYQKAYYDDECFERK